MRLLNVRDFTLREFYGNKIPPYAILSHRWLNNQDKEVTFDKLRTDPSWRSLPGSAKITFICQQALEDGYDWAWLDTCCINNANNSELSEAINSMFAWYQKSQKCYVYLMDTDLNKSDNFLDSTWWTRSWTLQELVAPKVVQFYDCNWQLIGSKTDLAEDIALHSGIDSECLHDARSVYAKSVAHRMSWAARRKATRPEDIAYSLLGIFGISMAMHYGEGDKAFVRLQKEIMGTTNDMSLFAWNFIPRSVDSFFEDMVPSSDTLKEPHWTKVMEKNKPHKSVHGLFAYHPGCFGNSGRVTFLGHYIGSMGIDEKHGNLSLRGKVINPLDLRPKGRGSEDSECRIAILPCSTTLTPHHTLVMLLRVWDRTSGRTMRDAFDFEEGCYTCRMPTKDLAAAKQSSIQIDDRSTIQRVKADISHEQLPRMFRIETWGMGDYNVKLIMSFVVHPVSGDERIRLIPQTPWERDRNSRSYLMSGSSQEIMLLVVRVSPISSFSNVKVQYIGIRLWPTGYPEGDDFHMAIRTLKSDWDITHYFREKLRKSSLFERDFWGTETNVRLRTKMVLNEAITTLSMKHQPLGVKRRTSWGTKVGGTATLLAVLAAFGSYGTKRIC